MGRVWENKGFSVKVLCISALFSWVEIFPDLYNFSGAHAILVATNPAYALYLKTPSI